MNGGVFSPSPKFSKEQSPEPRTFCKKYGGARSNEALLAGFFGVFSKMKCNSNLNFRITERAVIPGGVRQI
jgi:hypothetical protein